MINEAYVSYDIAKLLKEKGFDGKCKAFYEPPSKKLCEIRWEPKPYISYSQYENTDHIILSPSLAMAMAWLRKEKKVFIEPFVSIDLNGKYHFCFRLLNSECKDILQSKDLININFKDSYEEAVEAALLHVLQNLI